MTTSDPVGTTKRELGRDILTAARYYLGSHTGMVATAAVTLGAGAYLNWSWLVAAGIAPLIVGVLPCVAMCALGLCMARGSKSRGDAQVPRRNATGDAGQSHTLQLGASHGRADSADDTIGQSKPSLDNHKGCC